ncbi:hypothetical protein CIT31_25755 [Mesorhizobium wenxiniae]|uniref:Uncharacterized protein n=1 Tax=Mesorhizobium wenxiniae TaxID=2014805 RepID=A0A271KAF3_9HYPH|nr:hypothetical protein CIT31_25755 [Mesorhizobium wenxiniae]
MFAPSPPGLKQTFETTFVLVDGCAFREKAVGRQQRTLLLVAVFACVLGFVLLVLILQIVSLLD